MSKSTRFYTATAVGAFVAAVSVSALLHAAAPITVANTTVTISGTSNLHAYTASTTAVRVVRAEVAGPAGGNLWEQAMAPGGVAAFEITIPAATLSSPREGIDKNMHQALKVKEYADIVFRLTRLEAREDGAGTAIGTLQIAGVEREVTLDITTRAASRGLVVSGQTTVMMTDYGIKPPTAMLGMLKTNPKVTVSFETTLATPLT